MSCITDCSSCPSKGTCSIKNEKEGDSAIESKFTGKTVICIMSGKGGVGKSTIAAAIAHQISQEKKTCLIDTDIAGPSIARVTGVDSSQVIAEEHIPSKVDSLYVYTPEDKTGHRKGAEILKYLASIKTEEYEVIVIDTPPGTSDIHIALAKHIPDIKVVLITTPHKLSIGDTNRQISFCNKSNLEIVGIIENMSGYTCIECDYTVEPVRTAQLKNIHQKDLPYIRIPMNQKIAKESDNGIIKEMKRYVNIHDMKIFI